MRSIDEIIADRLAGEPLGAGEEAGLAGWEEGKFLACWQRLLRASGARERYLADRELPYRRIRAGAAARRVRVRRMTWGGAVASCVLLAWGVAALLPGGTGDAPAGTTARIVPGTPRAELKTGDGRRVSLAPGKDSVILSNRAVEVTNGEGTLTYAARQEGGEASRDTLVVPPGGEYSLVLADGTRVHLNAATSLSFPSRFEGEGVREVCLHGEAYFEVAADPSRPFIVRAGGTTARVLGTAFNVNAYAARRVVVTTLVEGRLRVSGGGETREMRPGEQATYREEEGRLEVREVAAELYTSWKDGYYLFREATLEEIMTTLATWYDANVLYATDRVKATRFTGRLQRFEEIQYLLEKFEETGAIAVTINGNDITLDKK